MIVFSTGETFEHKQAFERTVQKNGRLQSHLEIEVVGEFSDVKAAFTSGSAYSIRGTEYDEAGKPVLVDWDKSAFSKCASIRDNMNGVCTVDMYQLTEDEKTINAMAPHAPDEVAAAYPMAYEEWKGGVDYKTGDRRRVGKTVYKCRQDHTSQDIYPPNMVPALWTALNVSNAGTEADPIPAVRGMEYTYGLYYSDPEDGKIYQCSRSGETDGNVVVLQYLPHELIGQYFVAV